MQRDVDRIPSLGPWRRAIDRAATPRAVDALVIAWDEGSHDPAEAEEIHAYAEGRKATIREGRGERTNGTQQPMGFEDE